jgi:small subunit ribosomal protein S1
MNEQPNPANEFEEALREEFAGADVSVGDVIEGTIAAIHGDVALVEIGGKSEAVLARDELEELGTGDPVEVVVVEVGDEIRVSRRLALEQRLREKLSEAVQSGEPLDGKVVGRRKGGFDVTISGVRGFCPLSHIEDGRSDDLDQHLGQTYTFKVLEFDADSRKLVVSRAVYLREQKDRLRAETWDQLEVDSELDGTVRSLTNFGAFVDVGGVDGLVHVTEIAHRRINHPREALSEGDSVRVKVIELDRAKERVSLSIKQLQPNPWDEVSSKFPARGPFEGRVVRKTEFGAFVELEPGLDGLLHVSQLPPGAELDAPEFEIGATISGWVRDIDVGNERIGLTMRRLPDRDPWERIEMRYQEGQVVEGTVENGTDFGVFVELEPGLSALIPASELGLGRDVDPRTALTPGDSITAKVLSVDGGRQRMSLSVRAYRRDQERKDYLGHMDKGSEQPAVTGFGAQLMEALSKDTGKGKKKK